MKLVAIYNAWTDTADLLWKSINNIKPVVDSIIVVYSDWSYSGTLLEFPIKEMPRDNIHWINSGTSYNEVGKRNLGLRTAYGLGFTHFLTVDCDEFYRQEDIKRDREYLGANPDLNGLVCRIRVLFGKPTLTCDDHTLVPYIHKLKKGVECGRFPNYPFTSDEHGAHIDPTRRMNFIDGIEMSDTTMIHASWIRKDINLKIYNSPAARNLMKSTIYEDLANAKEGYYCKFYRQHLQSCENIFNL